MTTTPAYWATTAVSPAPLAETMPAPSTSTTVSSLVEKIVSGVTSSCVPSENHAVSRSFTGSPPVRFMRVSAGDSSTRSTTTRGFPGSKCGSEAIQS